MNDTRKVLRLLNCSAQLQYLPSGQCSISWQSVAYIDNPDEWPIWQEKFASPEGLPIYESAGILEETIEVLQADLEREKQRYADLQREFETFKVQSHAAYQDLGEVVTRQAAELQRLHQLERTLENLATWNGL